MAFVRKKTINGREYYYLVENHREDGKVRQKTIAYLGRYPTPKAAIEGLTAECNRRRARAEELRAKLEALPESYYTRTRRHNWTHLRDRDMRKANEAEQRVQNLKTLCSA